MDRTFLRLFASSLIVLFVFAASAAQAAEISDGDISWTVSNELLVDPVVPGETVDVRVTQGIVTLAGAR